VRSSNVTLATLLFAALVPASLAMGACGDAPSSELTGAPDGPDGSAPKSGDAGLTDAPHSADAPNQAPDAAPPAPPRASVLTQHNDVARTGANLIETTLTPARVKSAFGKLFEMPVDDQVYAQPLYVADMSVPGKGARDVLFVATVNNSLYAFDANDGTQLWKKSLGGAGVPVTHDDVGGNCGNYTDYSGNIGIVSTPAIDPASGTLYTVTRSKEGAKFVQRLHAVALADGSERAGSPVLIKASVKGQGDGNDGNGNVPFDPETANQRAGLLLSNGSVTIAWSSHCDTGPYHGWVMAYDAQTLAQTGVFNVTPDGTQGGIWQGGGGLVTDSSGNIFVATGNGDYDGNTNFGVSILKLTPRKLSLLDWFTASDWQAMNDKDYDFGSSGMILIPGTDHLAVGTKTGRLYVAATSSLGKLVDGDTQIVQRILADQCTVATNHIHGGPVFWNGPKGGLLYVWGENDYLRVFGLTGQMLSNDSIAQGTVLPPKGMPGGMLSISANGAKDGILWATHPTDGDANQAVRHGILRALDAADVTKELWNSMAAPEDDFGNFAKFVAPTVANGKVYLATFSNKVFVYGTH
jgi:hypothetical protein